MLLLIALDMRDFQIQINISTAPGNGHFMVERIL